MKVDKWFLGVGLGAIATGLVLVIAGTAATRRERAIHPKVRVNGELVPIGDEVVTNRLA